MNKQNVTLKSQAVAQDLEVIGQGGMVDKPCQIGEWWVMPAEQYTGTIPPEIMAKWANFKSLNVPVLGYLIADDMREVLLKREKEAEEKREMKAEADRQRRKEMFDKTAKQVAQVAKVGAKVAAGVAGVAVVVAAGAAVVTAGVIVALIRFDPILIAVLPDGRWVCLGAWWD